MELEHSDDTTAAQLSALVPDRRLVSRRVTLDALHEDPANARTHGPENLDAIEASFRRFGQAELLVVQAETGRVIGGNGRLKVMRKLGMTHADVVELEVDNLTATALGIALNRTGELAGWNEEVLSELLDGLREEDALVRGPPRMSSLPEPPRSGFVLSSVIGPWLVYRWLPGFRSFGSAPRTRAFACAGADWAMTVVYRAVNFGGVLGNRWYP